jgi:hypothetical protein
MSRDPFERSLEIEQAQLRGFARSIAEVEWLLLILVVLYLFVVNPALARSPSVLGVLIGFAATRTRSLRSKFSRCSRFSRQCSCSRVAWRAR